MMSQKTKGLETVFSILKVLTRIVPHSKLITNAIVGDSNLIALSAASVVSLVNIINVEVREQDQILQDALDECSIELLGSDPVQSVLDAVVRLLLSAAEAVKDSCAVFRPHRKNLLGECHGQADHVK
jgi:hypothetical protein